MSFSTTIDAEKGRCTFNKLKIASIKAMVNTSCVKKTVTIIALYCTGSLKKKCNDKEKSKEEFHNIMNF